MVQAKAGHPVRNDAPDPGFQAAIFDMDGVVTQTARLHAAAWKALFDEFLEHRAKERGEPFRPFDQETDYRRYVDGKPRHEGVRAFLAARGIQLPQGSKDDPPDATTVRGLARRKDGLFEQRIHDEGVQVFDSTIALIRALRAAGVKTGIVTSSRHGRDILESAHLASLFDARLDGVDLDERGLKGKPDPVMFLDCAKSLGAAPGRTIVFEDALAGVEAGKRGGFGLVVGVDRGGNRQGLERAGADMVVQDLAELDLERLDAAFRALREASAWRVEQEGFDPSREHQMESLFTVGNGYLGARGSLDILVPASQADLFVAGIYGAKHVELPYSEIEFLAPDRGGELYVELALLPFPFRLEIRVDGATLGTTGPQELRRTLDLRRAILHMEAVYGKPDEQRTAVRTRRCASLADPHLLLQEAIVTPENHHGKLACTALPADADIPFSHPHLELLEEEETSGMHVIRFATRRSRFEICVASHSSCSGSGADGAPLVMRRLVTIYTSRDAGDPRMAAIAHLQSLHIDDFDRLLAVHAGQWETFWTAADIRIADHPAVEQALRFNAYHLRIGASEDPRVSVPARSLSGRGYEGHVFWDTEIFMLPFYLHVAPELARSLLLYRFHTLDGARRRAQEQGYRGACFAWESTVTGADTTPHEIVLKSSGTVIPIFTGIQQIHVTADIAYAVWRYRNATGDDDFLAGAGAELLIETARFWASRVTRDGDHCHIRGVVGPDEYHHSVNDNAYTNWMARFNLDRAAWVAQWLSRGRPQQWDALRQRLALGDDEPDMWAGIAASLYCPQPGADGVIEQFEGFFQLENYSLNGEECFIAPVKRLFDWEQVNRHKLIKQADVLMLPLLFPEAFSDEVVTANYRYYEPLTDHASSLSPPVHAAIAARIGLRDDAERYWKRSLWLDLSNAMDNSALGVHPACMGATWQALVFGFLGVRLADTGPQINAHAATRLPHQWHSVAMQLAWRGHNHALRVGENS